MSEILSMIDPNNYGLQSMVAGGADLQEKTATPTTSQQVIQADEGYDGLSSVTVNAVTSAIDENIIPTNIRTGKTILGVQGNLEPDKPDQNKTVTPSTVQQVVVADTGYELAQVTVEAVPDETPELNAQDTALSNQETVIGQLSSALDNKIALDLADATSDANATANDIAKDKTAYVNGVKVTGVAEITDNNAKVITKVTTGQYATQINSLIVSIPILDCQGSSRSIGNLFSNCDKLTKVEGLVGTKNITSIYNLFYECSSLINIPAFHCDSVTNVGNETFRTGGMGSVERTYGGLINIGKGYTQQTEHYNNYKINLAYYSSQQVSHQGLMNIINNLYDLNQNENLSVNGVCQYRQELHIGSTNMAKLTAEEIAIATNKGWDVT